MSRLTDTLAEKFIGNPCAMPAHLRDKKHNDWFIGKFIPRSWNAKGPRCGKGKPGYLPWPPRLVEGRGVARWENSGAGSILEIPDLRECYVRAQDVYDKDWACVEWNPSNPNFNQVGTVTLRWEETAVGPDGQLAGANHWSPSALQKFSMRGWMKLDPDYYSFWRILERRETMVNPSGEDSVLFFRKGTRPDHLDIYYNLDKGVPVGMAGLKWE